MADRHLKILVVEDDKDDYLIIKTLLSESLAFTFDLKWARDYDGGIRAMFGGLHDICLLDYKLGERDGLRLLQEVYNHCSTVPVILLTGHGDYEVDVEAMRLGAMDYLVKGQIDADQLERSIRYSIERKRAEQELRRYRDQLEDLVAERTLQLEKTNRSLQLEIAERMKAEEERASLVIAIEQAGEGIIVTDLNGDIEYVNPAFENISGYSKSDLIYKNARMLKSGEHDETFYTQMKSTLRQGCVWKGRIVNRKKNGTLYEVEVTISPVKDCNGATVSYVGIHRDMTHEAALERHLRQTQKMEAMGTLAGGIAHNFNNILESSPAIRNLLSWDCHRGCRRAEISTKCSRPVPRQRIW
jgi:PAS domain S-box-containing protein